MLPRYPNEAPASSLFKVRQGSQNFANANSCILTSQP
jgi:hypothetical protein